MIKRRQARSSCLAMALEMLDMGIEPIACGEREWETEAGRPILDIARREGLEISIVSRLACTR